VSTVRISPDAARTLVVEAFAKVGMPGEAAEPAAQALVQADQEGLASHGLARVPFCVAQMRSGKVVAGAHFGLQASSLFDDAGPAPNLGHFILVLDPARFAPGFTERAEAIRAAIEVQPGARVPGPRRLAERAEAIEIPQTLHTNLLALAAG
jgi:LDH2 family malate/lactate/ureidoglycolate dehydrogenase